MEKVLTGLSAADSLMMNVGDTSRLAPGSCRIWQVPAKLKSKRRKGGSDECGRKQRWMKSDEIEASEKLVLVRVTTTLVASPV